MPKKISLLYNLFALFVDQVWQKRRRRQMEKTKAKERKKRTQIIQG